MLIVLFKFRLNQFEHPNVSHTLAFHCVARYELTEPWFRLCDMEEYRGLRVARKKEFLRSYRQGFSAAFVEAAADRCVARRRGGGVDTDTVPDTDGGPNVLDHRGQRGNYDTTAGAEVTMWQLRGRDMTCLSTEH